MNDVSLGQKLGRIGSKIISLLAVIIILIPIVWMVRTSIILPVQIYTKPPLLIFTPNFSAYYRSFINQHLIVRFTNSIIISLSAVLIAVFVGSMAAYGISRFPFPSSKHFPIGFLFLRMLPGIAVLLPLFLMYVKFGIIDTYPGMIIAYSTASIPMVIWMLWGFFRDLPIEIEESAYLDGCGNFATFIRIVLPITKPAIAAVSILAFTGCWNEFVLATILSRTITITLPPGVVSLMSQTDLAWDQVSAGGTVLSIPIILLCIFAQKYFVSGLTVGAIKG